MSADLESVSTSPSPVPRRDDRSMLWLGLIRNVMLGRDGLTRDVLLHALESSGAEDGQSYLTTDNVTFGASRDEVYDVVLRFEDRLELVLGRSTPCMVRSLAWLRELVAEDRFAHFDDHWETEVGFLHHNAPAVDESRIVNTRRTVLVEVRAREILTARPRTGGARPHVNRLLEQATSSPATARGWSTLQRIAETASPAP